MRHFDLLLMRHPHLRHIDYQRLVQRVKEDPEAHWDELVEASAPVVHTAAYRLALGTPDAAASAEDATREVFERLKADDFRIVRDYVGYGKWVSELVLLTEQTPTMEAVRDQRIRHQSDLSLPVSDPDGEIPVLEPRYAELLEKEGDRFLKAITQVMGLLHRTDRLILALRYEQELTLAELDQVFRLGTPSRVGSLIDRLVRKLQPIQAVADAWELPDGQRHALTRVVVQKVFATANMETDEDAAVAPATQGQ